ncbi:MAG: amidohydrolase family protein [Mariniphaga sp.]
MKKFYLMIVLCLVGLAIINCSPTPPDFYSFPKIDVHTHFNTNNPIFIELGAKENFKFLSIVTSSGSRVLIDRQLEYAVGLKKKCPENFNFTTTFSMENFNEPGWEEEVLEKLKADFKKGAVAVKVWKDIGMVFRNKDSTFIMIDDPKFDRILDFIEANGKTLVAHIAEPRNCWLPIDSMTVNNDKNYYTKHPEYHMFMHPDYPSYDELIVHRDKMLEKHPHLRVVGCHLGSLEWDVNELALRFDRYPNFFVDVAARICHFQVQDRKKVREFIIKYQDRILYGTDLEVSENEDQKKLFEEKNRYYLDDWKYFTTDSILSNSKSNKPFQGLNLPKEVLERIYFKNALICYHGIN